MTEQYTLADRLRARARQLGLKPAQIAELAGVKRSFVYDILRSRSTNPGREQLLLIAEILSVPVSWLLNGIGSVDGSETYIENPNDAFMGITPAGLPNERKRQDADKNAPHHAFRFRLGWIKNQLGSSPSRLRITEVKGAHMMPTLLDGDTVLVDTAQTAPNPPGLFLLDEGLGPIARRLEHIPSSNPPAVRVISDNNQYSPYERSAGELNIIGRIRWFGRKI